MKPGGQIQIASFDEIDVLQDAPFLQGSFSQGSTSVSQVSPSYPGEHSQVNPVPFLEQTPSFLQGDSALSHGWTEKKMARRMVKNIEIIDTYYGLETRH